MALPLKDRGHDILTAMSDPLMLHVISPADAITRLKQAMPYVTARPFGHAVMLIGAPGDLVQARELLRQLDAPGISEPNTTLTLMLKHAPQADVQQVLAARFPRLKAQKIGDESLGITGPESEVARAADLVRQLDDTGLRRCPLPCL